MAGGVCQRVVVRTLCARLLDFAVIAYTRGGDHSYLMLIQAPEGTNLDRLEAASADASPDHFAPRGEVTAVDTLDVRTPGKLCAPSSAKGAAGPRW